MTAIAGVKVTGAGARALGMLCSLLAEVERVRPSPPGTESVLRCVVIVEHLNVSMEAEARCRLADALRSAVAELPSGPPTPSIVVGMTAHGLRAGERAAVRDDMRQAIASTRAEGEQAASIGPAVIINGLEVPVTTDRLLLYRRLLEYADDPAPTVRDVVVGEGDIEVMPIAEAIAADDYSHRRSPDQERSTFPPDREG
jgi:hypothetical protein